ncbi:MAG: RND transporter, partial [Chitinophagia bacterium]|nr:RND transporter [Chitinophagia bacterium]
MFYFATFERFFIRGLTLFNCIYPGMWHAIASIIIKYRVALLVVLLGLTGIMGYYATQLRLSYEFTGAVPTDNVKYKEYKEFKRVFGEDGNLVVVGIQSNDLFTKAVFEPYTHLAHSLALIPNVEQVLSIPDAVMLAKDTAAKKLRIVPLRALTACQTSLDSFKQRFYSLPFYNGFLYNRNTNAYLMAVRINKSVINSDQRIEVVKAILDNTAYFETQTHLPVHVSGLPLIRTQMARRLQEEMKLFLLLSFVLTALILTFFFRSFSAVLSSMLVVAITVVWSMGTMTLLGYKITLLTALIPPLLVVIGIPNCVYLLNRYHAEYKRTQSKMRSLLRMVDRMGVVTLFTNLTAAIGFGVFFFTKSTLLQEFGLVAGLNILALFAISLVFIPAFFSFLPPPKVHHISYLESNIINKSLARIWHWVFSHRIWIYGFSALAVVLSLWGVTKLKKNSHIVDDLPQSDVVLQDLRFFEANFKGVMPLEIVIDCHKKNGVLRLEVLEKLDSLTAMLHNYSQIGRPVAIIDGIKFARQAYYDGDSSSYALPTSLLEASFIVPYLRTNNATAGGNGNTLMSRLLLSFVDSNKQKARISVGMADIGTERLPMLLDTLQTKINILFPKPKYTVTCTGTSITFLEGNKFIVHSLRDSIIFAFIIIFGFMLLAFRSWQIVLISVIVNIVPLLLTAGLMGWLNIRIKPSTVLVFSIALGITIDVTIRFLVSFKQELARRDDSIANTVERTINDTGLSILYTSLILITGFGVFALSHFDG